MSNDPAAEMRQKYGETQGKTCGECKLCLLMLSWRLCVEREIVVLKDDPACGKFEEDPS